MFYNKFDGKQKLLIDSSLILVRKGFKWVIPQDVSFKLAYLINKYDVYVFDLKRDKRKYFKELDVKVICADIKELYILKNSFETNIYSNKPLCLELYNKVQNEFGMYCIAIVVPSIKDVV